MAWNYKTIIAYIIAYSIHLIPLYIAMFNTKSEMKSWMFGLCVLTFILSQSVASLITIFIQIKLDEEAFALRESERRQRILTMYRN